MAITITGPMTISGPMTVGTISATTCPLLTRAVAIAATPDFSHNATDDPVDFMNSNLDLPVTMTAGCGGVYIIEVYNVLAAGLTNILWTFKILGSTGYDHKEMQIAMYSYSESTNSSAPGGNPDTGPIEVYNTMFIDDNSGSIELNHETGPQDFKIGAGNDMAIGGATQGQPSGPDRWVFAVTTADGDGASTFNVRIRGHFH